MKIRKKGEYNDFKASVVRMHSIALLVVIYKFIVNIGTLIDYIGDGEFRYIGSVLFLPDIAILTIFITFLTRIFKNRISLANEFEKRTIYITIFVISLIIAWSIFDIMLSIFTW